jgi:hypothetical protein
MKRITRAVCLVALLSFAADARADNFDGTWRGSAPSPTASCPGATFEMIVANGKITGSMITVRGAQGLTGSVSTKGAFVAGAGRDEMLSGHLSGNKLAGTVRLSCGRTAAIGEKAS